uniref:Putative pogo transposable element n=1 Tax=Ixodes ricinus TaxID=34613 RepID=A0A147BLR1_IXORI
MGRYSNYTAAFKLKAIDYAIEHGNRAASRHFGVNEFNVRYWRRQHGELQATNRTRRAFRGPKTGKFPRIETLLMDYVKALRADGCAVSIELLCNQARAIARKEGVPAQDFRASNGWATRFMRRNGLSLRRRTTLCQRLPEAYEDKIVDFHRFVIRIRQQNNFLLSQIGNADQTPLNFDMPSNTTLEQKGARTVHVRTTGAEKQRCTVMLAVTADGRKLPPYVIFKRKTLPKGKFPPGVHIRVQEKGWMSADLMVDWLKTVWGRRPGALLFPSLLVLDSFRGHLVEPVRAKLRELRTDLAVIPGGLTSVLQPLDVSLNKPFKDNVRRLYAEWMAEGQHDLTPAGKIRRPSVEQLCSWIAEAWGMIGADIIVKSFKKTGISNALDATEDHLVWDEDESETDEKSGGDDGATTSDATTDSD